MTAPIQPFTFALCSETKLVTPSMLHEMLWPLEQNAQDCAKAWGLPPPAIVIANSYREFPVYCRPIVFVDSEGDPGVLAVHYWDPVRNGPAGRVYVDHTSGLRTGPYSVFESAAHEVLEALLDPTADEWRPHPTMEGVEVAYENCVAGDTIIALGDGSLVPIARLASEGGRFNVLSVNALGKPVLAEAHSARRTRRDAETVLVWLTDGEAIRCTADHRVLMADGTYRRAGSLRPGDRVSNVRPELPVPDAGDGGSGYVVPPRERNAALVALSNGANDFSGELRASVEFSAPIPVAGHAALGRGIEHVFLPRAEEQVRGVGADSVVASMADLHPLWDRSEVDLVGEPVDGDVLPVEAELAIAGGGHRAWPIPAAVGLHDSGPEDLRGRGRLGEVVGREASVDTSVPLDPAVVKIAEALRNKLPSASIDRTRAHSKVVDRVQSAGKVDVFDLTVPVHHNFAIGAGVFVHNCDPCQDTYAIFHAGVEWPAANFITPAWFDAKLGDVFERQKFLQAGGRFDFANRLERPGQLSPDGYVILRRKNDAGEWVYYQEWGSFGAKTRAQTNPNRLAAAAHPWSRTLHRLAGCPTLHRPTIPAPAP